MQSDDEILKEAKSRFERAWARDRHNLEAELEDLEFEAGDQWPKAYLAERKDGRWTYRTREELDVPRGALPARDNVNVSSTDAAREVAG